jgi:hypothetical protein
MLQDVSTAIMQHQQPHADGLGGPPQQQQPAPPADVVRAGIAALDMLATVCGAAASALHADVCRRNMVPQLCDRDMLDSPACSPACLQWVQLLCWGRRRRGGCTGLVLQLPVLAVGQAVWLLVQPVAAVVASMLLMLLCQKTRPVSMARQQHAATACRAAARVQTHLG